MASVTNPIPKRRWFQIHLSTAVVLMFVTGGLIWANIPREERYIEKVTWDGSEVMKWAFEDNSVPLDQLGDCHVESESCGWPFVWRGYRRRDLPMEITMRPSSPRLIAYDVAICLAIILTVACACEFLIRRREARKQ